MHDVLGSPARPDSGSAGSDGPEVFSCDVFDTVLTHAVADRENVFLLLGVRLAGSGVIRCSPQAFRVARQEAERRARANVGGVPALQQVYDELQFDLHLEPDVASDIMQHEIALEHELTRPVPGAAERLARARAAGQRVRFLSDAAMPEPVLRSLLERHGLLEPGDRIMAGSENGAAKADGAAFERLVAAEGVPPQRVLHRGSDALADVAAAARAGVRVEPFLQGNLNRYEQLLSARAMATEGLAAAMAGAARLARLSVAADTPRQAALRDVAASVGAPALVSYILWVLLRSRELGIRRLYFLARDGYVLMLIAERLAARLGIDIDMRYLHGGRQAWYVPSISDVDPQDLFWAVDYASSSDGVETFLRRIGIEAADVEPHLEELGLPRSTWSLPRPPADHELLWSIPRHPGVRAAVLEGAAQKREQVLAYFEQEGLLDGSDWALVDVGWSGRLLGAMNKVLATRDATIPAAFFFARFVDREKHRFAPVPIHAWLGDYPARRGLRGRMNELFVELFCGANQGVTTAYANAGGRFEPVFSSPTQESLVKWGLETVHRTILSFVDHLWLDPSTVPVTAEMRRTVADVFQPFVTSPTADEAEAWGSYPFEYGRNGSVAATLATPLTLRQLPRILRNGTPRTRSGTEWKEGSIARTPPATRIVLQSAIRLRAAAGFFARHTRGPAGKLRRTLGLTRGSAGPDRGSG